MVHIKRITLNGFKSYKAETVIELDEHVRCGLCHCSLSEGPQHAQVFPAPLVAGQHYRRAQWVGQKQRL